MNQRNVKSIASLLSLVALTALSSACAKTESGASDETGGALDDDSGAQVQPTVPAAHDDAYSVNEDATLTRSVAQGVLGNDDAPSGVTLTAALVANVTGGSLTFNADGSFIYVPSADTFGTDTFTYEINDGSQTYGPATVTLTVASLNDAPTIDAISNPGAISEDGSITGVAFTADEGGGTLEDGQSLTVTATSSNTALVPNANITVQYTADGSGDATGGTVDVTPAANENGMATITVTVQDNGTGSLTAQSTFDVTVNAANDTPTISDVADQSTAEDTAITGLAFTVDEGGASDEDAQALTVTAVSSNQSLIPNANITVNYAADAGADATGGSLDLMPASNASGTATITVTAQDDGTGALSAVDTFVVTVSAVDDAPAVALPSASLSYVAGNSAMPIDPSATVSDVDSADFSGGVLTVSFTANGSVDDRLSVLDDGSAAGHIGVSGANISYGGTLIGVASGGTDGSTPLTVTLNASATPAVAQALLRRVAFRNVSADPSNSDRTVEFTLGDGDGATSTGVSKTIAVYDAPSNLLGLYQFEDTPNTLTTVDGSGLGNTGALTGFSLSTWITPGFIGRSLKFLAASQSVVQTPITLVSEDAFTLSVWIKPDASTLTAAQHVIWQGNSGQNGWGNGTSFNAANHEMHLSLNYFSACFTGVNFYYGGTDAVALDGSCADIPTNVLVNDPTALSSTAWTHVAVTLTGANGATVTAKLYVNGTLKATDTGTEVSRSQWNTNLRFASPGAATRYYNGELDHIRIYNRALAGSEITTLSQEGRP